MEISFTCQLLWYFKVQPHPAQPSYQRHQNVHNTLHSSHEEEAGGENREEQNPKGNKA